MSQELRYRFDKEEFLLRTATIDERLSNLFIEIPGQKTNTLEAQNILQNGAMQVQAVIGKNFHLGSLIGKQHMTKLYLDYRNYKKIQRYPIPNGLMMQSGLSRH